MFCRVAHELSGLKEAVMRSSAVTLLKYSWLTHATSNIWLYAGTCKLRCMRIPFQQFRHRLIIIMKPEGIYYWKGSNYHIINIALGELKLGWCGTEPSYYM